MHMLAESRVADAVPSEHLDVLILRAAASRGSAPAHISENKVSVGIVHDLRGASTPSGARRTYSATRASARIRTSARSATRSAPGTARRRSPTATTRSCSTSSTAAARPASAADPLGSAHIVAATRRPRADRCRPRHGDPGRTARADSGEVVTLAAGFMFGCSGFYRYDHGYLPDFAGIHETFEGTTVRPEAWPRTT